MPGLFEEAGQTFPNRPNHPDFWCLSELILQLNARISEDRKPVRGEVAQEGDEHSVLYMSSQRVLQAFEVIGKEQTGAFLRLSDIQPILQMLWIEGFIIGSRFEKKGGHVEVPS